MHSENVGGIKPQGHIKQDTQSVSEDLLIYGAIRLPIEKFQLPPKGQHRDCEFLTF